MATTEAVHRRRMNRKARRAVIQQRSDERERHDAKVAHKMTTRFYGSMPPHLMVLGYMYWQARKCGWDALSEKWARDERGQPCDPMEGVAWRFWRTLHYKTREQLVRLSSFRLIRRR